MRPDSSTWSLPGWPTDGPNIFFEREKLFSGKSVPAARGQRLPPQGRGKDTADRCESNRRFAADRWPFGPFERHQRVGRVANVRWRAFPISWRPNETLKRPPEIARVGPPLTGARESVWKGGTRRTQMNSGSWENVLIIISSQTFPFSSWCVM